MMDIWWKFQVYWKRGTEVKHFLSLTFCQIDLTFQQTSDKTKIINNKDLKKLYKSITKVKRWSQKNFQVIVDFSFYDNITQN